MQIRSMHRERMWPYISQNVPYTTEAGGISALFIVRINQMLKCNFNADCDWERSRGLLFTEAEHEFQREASV